MTKRKKNPGKKAKRWYCVDQSQKGLWYQIGYFSTKSAADKLAAWAGGKTRVKLTFPSGKSHPIVRGKINES